MHYAEFGEDEVGRFLGVSRSSIPFPRTLCLRTDKKGPECSALVRHQGVRCEQVEVHRPKGWQTGQSVYHPPQSLVAQIVQVGPANKCQACEQYAKEHFGGKF